MSAALVIGLPAVVFVASGSPLEFEIPKLRGFNFIGGQRLSPELVSLLFALTLYTAAFIAEIVRSGILAVNKGQSEAAAALGLRPGPTRKLVIMPQAMRVIIPPLINQYLNLAKNSTLAVAIGYPDLFNVFAGTTLNNTGRRRADHLHDDGGLSRHQPDHVGRDERLQRAHVAEGAVR